MNTDLQFDGGFTSESWEYARAFAGSLGTIPSTFTSVIRLLLSDFEKDPGALSEYGRFFAGRLLKSPSMHAPYFFAIRYLKPHLITTGQPFSLRDFLRAFSGYEHACLLGTVYLYRHSCRVCDAALVQELFPRLQRNLNLGWLVGNSLPSIGGGPGLLVGGIRVLGLLPFIKHDLDGFNSYLQHLKQRQLSLDINYEFQRWQCNSLQVGLVLFQQLGFGLSRVIPLQRAMTTTSPLLQPDECERGFRIIDVWINSLATSRTAPSIPLPPKYYPGAKELAELLEKAQTNLQDNAAGWLSRSKNDLTNESAAELLMGDAHFIEAVPEELKETLPDETINELSTQLIADLLNEDAKVEP